MPDATMHDPLTMRPVGVRAWLATPPATAALAAIVLGAVSTAGATIYLVAGAGSDGRSAGLREALAWQGSMYLAWVPVAAVVAWAVERAARHRRTWLGPVLVWWPAVLAHALVSAWLTGWLRPGTRVGASPGADMLIALVRDDLPRELLQYWALVAVVLAVRAQRRLRERERAAAGLEAALTRARLDTLRARLRPHFLLNTLQSISLLIPRDPDAAQRMTVHLGDLLRASFAAPQSADGGELYEVLLRDELALVRAYLVIEGERFRDRLDIRWSVDDATLDARVPDLLLQPLVENALRHGLWPKPGPGTLTVRATVRGARLVITVGDDGVGLPPTWRDGDRDGTGLGATRERLLGLYGDAGILRVAPAPGGGTQAEVELPLAVATCETAPTR